MSVYSSCESNEEVAKREHDCRKEPNKNDLSRSTLSAAADELILYLRCASNGGPARGAADVEACSSCKCALTICLIRKEGRTLEPLLNVNHESLACLASCQERTSEGPTPGR